MNTSTQPDQKFSTVSALRIYLKHGDNKKAPSFLGRLFEKPLSTHLVHASLKAGITHASVNLGHIGFAKGAAQVTVDISELPMSTLPVCVELLAPRRILEQFVRDQATHLKDSTLVMVDGVHLSVRYLVEMEEAIEKKPHRVEYISSGTEKVQVDQVEA
jgi:PII-like signaling protein